MDIAFTNGIAHLGAGLPDTDRIFVRDGRITDWPAEVPRTALTVDLGGGYLGPAFADGHVHPMLAAAELRGPRIGPANTVEEIGTIVAAWANDHPDAEWIVGGSYDATIVENSRFDARWLDAVVADRPVVLRAWDYHTVWCNSRALELAGVTSATPDPPLGRIVRRADGTPEGTLLESATALVLGVVPAPPLADRVDSLVSAVEMLAARGITWAQEAWADADDIEVWVEAAQSGRLVVDFDIALRADPLRWPQQLGELEEMRAKIAETPGLTADTVKFFVDGIIENHTAHMLDPYADACDHGLPNWTAETLAPAVIDVDTRGFDVHLHAIGDAGVRSALDSIERLDAVSTRPNRRATIAHAQVIHPADLERFASLGVIACFQPLAARADPVMTNLTIPRLGPDRELQHQMGALRAAGATISFGSDWPVFEPDVITGMWTAVHRQNPDGTPVGGWQPQERLTVEQALDTATAAVKQSRTGALDGSLAVGGRADLVWLSSDPRSLTTQSPESIEVLGTWRRGSRTHSAGDAARHPGKEDAQ